MKQETGQTQHEIYFDINKITFLYLTKALRRRLEEAFPSQYCGKQSGQEE